MHSARGCAQRLLLPASAEFAEELELLERLDRIFTDHPVYGSRRLQVALLREEISVGRRRVRRLMRKLGLWAVRPKRNTSKRHPGHKVYPYFCAARRSTSRTKHGPLTSPTSPCDRGFCTWSRSSTGHPASAVVAAVEHAHAGFCVEALSEALARFGKPGIFNTDQSAAITSDEFTKMLTDHGIAISMDGRGRCHDNISSSACGGL